MLIRRDPDDLLAAHFGIEKTWELIAQKYYWPMLSADVEFYVKECNIYLAWKLLRYKPYSALQTFLFLTHQSKNLSIDFAMGLPICID